MFTQNLKTVWKANRYKENKRKRLIHDYAENIVSSCTQLVKFQSANQKKILKLNKKWEKQKMVAVK